LLLGETNRVIKCGGRVFAAQEDPDVKRIWMPEGDCPGLAMSRAFGDFCLKDHGLSSVPDLSYRKLTKQDEFVVLASDGVSTQYLLFLLECALCAFVSCVVTISCSHTVSYIGGC
jgi:hypothetical protein